jgi:hypothetical protein
MDAVAARRVERSIDSLDRTYAVIIALAITHAIQLTFIAPSGELALTARTLQLAPSLLALIVTTVPFSHGMNRHLDSIYVENAPLSVREVLLLDFLVFFIEACLLFGFAASIRAGKQAFIFLGVLLAVDAAWGLVSRLIHRKIPAASLTWAAINVVAILTGAMFYRTTYFAEGDKPWFLSAVAIVRSVIDYWANRDFYFPVSLPGPGNAQPRVKRRAQ